MSVRYRRQVGQGDDSAVRELAELAHSGRGRMAGQVRLRQMMNVGDRLGMTSGDTVRLATETLLALDRYGELQPAIAHVLEGFDSGRLLTGVREPMNLYLDRSAVSVLAVAVCEQCRPGIPVQEANPGSNDRAAEPEIAATGESEPGGQPEQPEPSDDVAAGQLQHVAHWPERTGEGFPRMTLHVKVWWPGLQTWEEATLTAIVSQSLAFTGENFTLLIEQAGDTTAARTNAVWLVKRSDLPGDGYELRASTWEMGDDDAHRYRFLVASSSPWCVELHDYLAARWISLGQSPTGPEEFDGVALGDHPSIRPAVAPA